MAGLKDATKKPDNIGEQIEVPTAPSIPSLIPREQPGLATGSMGPAPSIFTTEYDRVRQWFRPGTSQNRFPPLPIKANPQINAAASSVASVAAQTVVQDQPVEDVESILVNPQTGTTYTVQSNDRDTLISMSNAAGGIVTLPGIESSGISAPFSFVQYVTNPSNTVSSTLSLTNTRGNLMVLTVKTSDPGSSNPPTVIDTKGNTWHLELSNTDGGNLGSYLFYAYNIAGGANVITITNASNTSFCYPTVAEFAGFGPTDPLGPINHSTSAPTTVTTLAVNTMVFSCIEFVSSSYGPASVGAGFTLIHSGTFASFDSEIQQYQFVPISGTAVISDSTSPVVTGSGASNLEAAFVTTQFIPPTSGVDLAAGFFTYIQNTGAGTFAVQVADGSSTLIDGSASPISLSPNSGVLLVFDGTNWYTERGMGSGGGVTAANIQNEAFSYAADTGAANAYAIALTPAVTSYAAGQLFTFKAANANTTTSTLAVNGLTTKTIKKLGNTNLASGDISVGLIVTVVYDGTNFQMISGIANTFTAPVTSVFGRTGAVVAATNDYTQTQIASGAIANGSTATTQSALDNSTKVATTAYADAADAVVSAALKVGIQSESYTFATDTGAANAYAIATSPAIAAYAAGQRFQFKAANANTTASTLAVSGLATKTIQKNGAALVANDILANEIVDVIYDGTQFQMINPSGITEYTNHKDAASGYAGLDSGTMLKLPEQATSVDARTSTSEAITDSDRAKLVTFSNTAAIAATIAQAGASSLFLAGWYADIINLNTGTVTLTPATSTINNQTTLVLERYEGGRLVSDGTNYWFIAGQPTLDTPIDADILSFETATKRWRSKAIGTVGGANASQLRGNNISSASPLDQQILRWTSADSAYDLVFADGVRHGAFPSWSDPGFVYYRDDFNYGGVLVTSTAGATTNNTSGICWDWNPGSGASARHVSPIGGNLASGAVGWNTGTTVNTFSMLAWPGSGQFLSSTAATSGTASWQSLALLDYPGWSMSWIFGWDDVSAPDVAPPTFANRQFYAGLCPHRTASGSWSSIGGVNGRPPYFIGLRYDTDRGRQFNLVSVANAAGGNTVYSTTASALTAGEWVGAVLTITGFTTAANNGTFTVSANTTSTLTVNNASGVAETKAAGFTPSVPLTSVANASGGTTVYTGTHAGLTANELAGQNVTIAGFTTSANNGTFLCNSNTTTTITLVNASGASETHAATAATPSILDTVFVFEVVQNLNLSNTNVRNNTQGTTFSTGITPTFGVSYRLNMVCNASGTVVMTLSGGGQTATHTFTGIAQVTTAGQTGASNIQFDRQNGKGSFSVTASPTTLTNCFSAAPGTKITVTGATNSTFNSTFTILYDIQSNAGLTTQQTGVLFTLAGGTLLEANSPATVTYNPGLCPYIAWGNDAQNTVDVTMAISIDFFGLTWNPGILTTPGTVDATQGRYFS